MTDVLITGASRGIGLALTREYLCRGARVFAAVRDPDHADKLREQPADRLEIVRLDVTSPADVASAAATVAARTDGLDLLVNNAGIMHYTKGLSEVDGARMLDLLHVNTVGPLLVTQRFAPLLKPQARLVNITLGTPSIGNLTITDNHAFIASRYAHNALTRMVAVELTGRAIVVALWPGYLRTDLNNHAAEAAPPDEKIPGVVDLIERLGPDDHGACLRPDGSHTPW